MVWRRGLRAGVSDDARDDYLDWLLPSSGGGQFEGRRWPVRGADGTPYALKVTPFGPPEPGRGTSGHPLAAPRPSRTPVFLVMAAFALAAGMAVYTLMAMFGGWQKPQWWPPVFGVVLGASLLTGKLYSK